MRSLLLITLPILLAACGSGDKWADNVATPPLETIAEAPGDWSALDGMIGRRPSESGLIDSSAVSTDLNSTIGPSVGAYRNAMMAAGPLTRRGEYLVSRAPDAWLVLDPAGHAFRAALRRGGRWEEWHTPGADLPGPATN